MGLILILQVLQALTLNLGLTNIPIRLIIVLEKRMVNVFYLRNVQVKNGNANGFFYTYTDLKNSELQSVSYIIDNVFIWKVKRCEFTFTPKNLPKSTFMVTDLGYNIKVSYEQQDEAILLKGIDSSEL